MKTIFSILKAKIFPVKAGSSQIISGNKVPFEDMNILDHIEKIVELVKNQGIDKSLVTGKRHISYVADKLGINPLQALLFSLFMERCDDNSIVIKDIAESAKCSKIRIIKYMNDCEELEKKG